MAARFQAHPFFQKHEIDWSRLSEITAPFLPNFDDVEDVSYFSRMHIYVGSDGRRCIAKA
jgi:hypothetical protein